MHWEDRTKGQSLDLDSGFRSQLYLLLAQESTYSLCLSLLLHKMGRLTYPLHWCALRIRWSMLRAHRGVAWSQHSAPVRYHLVSIASFYNYIIPANQPLVLDTLATKSFLTPRVTTFRSVCETGISGSKSKHQFGALVTYYWVAFQEAWLSIASYQLFSAELKNSSSLLSNVAHALRLPPFQ